MKRNESGFTFVEVLIALLVFSIMSGAFLWGLQADVRYGILLDGRTTAEALAKGEIEYIQAHVYQSNVTWGYSLTNSTGSRPWPGGNIIPAEYTLTVTPGVVAGYPVTDMQQVTVVVTRGASGQPLYTNCSLTFYWRKS